MRSYAAEPSLSFGCESGTVRDDDPVPDVTQSGPFAEHRLRATLDQACRHAGLDQHGADLLHITVNAIFRLADAPIIVRIAASTDLLPKVQRVVAAARWFEQRGLAAVRLAPIDQPFVVARTGHVVTYWRYLPQTDPPLAADDLAEPLRRLHALPQPDFPLPIWDPIVTARARIAQYAHGLLAPDVRAWFESRAEGLRRELECLDFPLRRSVIHGDAYVGNLLRDEQGSGVLCDFDELCLGPPEWDLIPELVGHLRYHRSDLEYQRLVDSYGFDPRTWSGHDVLRRVRELLVLTGVLPVLDSSPGIAAEFHHRVDAMRAGDTDAQWTPFGRAA